MRSKLFAAYFIMALSMTAMPARAADGDGDKFNIDEQTHLVEFGVFLGGFFIPESHALHDKDVGHKAMDKSAFILGLRAAYLPLRYVGLEVEAALIPIGLRGGDDIATVYTVRGHVIGQLPWWRVTPFLLVGYGLQGVSSTENALGSDEDGALHVGLGVKWYVTNKHILRADGRVNIGDKPDPDPYAPQFEFLVGASYVLGWEDPPDRDSDGVIDEVDQCPDRAGDKPTGCPPDKDSDGVYDADDKCVDLAGDKPTGCPPDKDGDGVYDEDDKCVDLAGDKPTGCPPDKDGDGVYDKDDKCVDLAGDKPTGCPPDKDGDGVYDKDDKCPKKPGPKPDGCPPDKDGDGIADADDKCPEKPENKNGYQDKDGCPDSIPRKLKRFTGAIKGIYFDSGKATIRKKSNRVLDKAVKILKQFPDTRIKIEGHTDDVGKDDANLKLSEERAKSVKQYFVDKGIMPERLQSVGKGETEPVAKGKSRRARAKNRRIEFKLIIGEAQ